MVTTDVCPVCGFHKARIAYGYGHYQFQCDGCGWYALASDNERDARDMALAFVPGAQGLLLEAHSILEIAYMARKDAGAKPDDYFLELYCKQRAKIETALRYYFSRRKAKMDDLMRDIPGEWEMRR